MRTQKMDMGQKINEYRKSWYRNFIGGIIFYGTISAMLATWRRRTFLGVPIFTRNYFNKPLNLPDRRLYKNMQLMKFFVTSTFLASYAHASYFTSMKHF